MRAGHASAGRECRSSAEAMWISGRPTSNAESASRGSSIVAIGPSHTAASERGSPTAKNGGRLNAVAMVPAFGDDLGPDPGGIAERDGQWAMGTEACRRSYRPA